MAALLSAVIVAPDARTARAQVSSPRELPGAVQPGRERPLPTPPTQPDFDFTIQPPNRTQVPRSVQELHFTLKDIRVEGSVTFPAESFRSLYEGLIGQEITVANVLDIADHIEDRYRQAGYVLTHAYVPAQRVRDGVFTINVVEGYVASISTEGGDPATQTLVRDYLQPILDSRPFQLATTERALLLANDLPGVTASGVLRPSPNVIGASDLLVTITERRLTGGLAVDNRDSPFTDRWLFTGDVEADSLALAGDQLALTASSARNALEKQVAQARYQVPIGTVGTTASFIATYAHAEPSGATLFAAHLVTDSYAIGPRIDYPLLRSRAASLALDGGFTVQDARAREPGLLISHDQWRVADISANYSGVSALGSSAATLDLAQGLGILGATNDGTSNNGVPLLSRSGNTTGNPEFTKVTATVRHTRQIVGPLSFLLAAQAQYAFAPLLAGEQIAFGGTQIGRGYDPSAITGDHGVGGSFELRYDARVAKYGLDGLQPYLFYDVAKVWSVKGGAPALSVTAVGIAGTGSGLAIASTGVGVRFFLDYNITGGVEFAQTLKPVPGSDAGRYASKVLLDAAVRF